MRDEDYMEDAEAEKIAKLRSECEFENAYKMAMEACKYFAAWEEKETPLTETRLAIKLKLSDHMYQRFKKGDFDVCCPNKKIDVKKHIKALEAEGSFSEEVISYYEYMIKTPFPVLTFSYVISTANTVINAQIEERFFKNKSGDITAAKTRLGYHDGKSNNGSNIYSNNTLILPNPESMLEALSAPEFSRDFTLPEKHERSKFLPSIDDEIAKIKKAEKKWRK